MLTNDETALDRLPRALHGEGLAFGDKPVLCSEGVSNERGTGEATMADGNGNLNVCCVKCS